MIPPRAAAASAASLLRRSSPSYSPPPRVPAPSSPRSTAFRTSSHRSASSSSSSTPRARRPSYLSSPSSSSPSTGPAAPVVRAVVGGGGFGGGGGGFGGIGGFLGSGFDERVGGSRSHFSAVSPSYVLAMPVKVVEVPTMGDSITEGTIVDLPVAPGDYVSADDVVVVLETDKVSVDVRAPESGAIVEILGEVDDVVSVGTGLFRIDTDASAPEGGGGGGGAEGGGEGEGEGEEAPAPDSEEGTPPAAAAAAPAPAPPPPPPPPPPKADAPSPPPPPETKSPPPPPTERLHLGGRTERRTKMSRMRQRVAARLKDAQNTAAMLTTFQECDMGNIMEMRSRHKDAFQDKHGVKLGFMSAFVKAATAALQEIPAVNAYIDDGAKEVVYREYVDVSVAVASPTGLVVPVLRNTEAMSFADVERSINMYAQKARDGTLSLDDMAGGTFTISNGGVFGSLMGTPIINPPQSAILGMHATKMRAVVDDKGQVVARPMMYLALTYDHRLIDGREGVTFLKSIAEKIADPSRLLLEL